MIINILHWKVESFIKYNRILIKLNAPKKPYAAQVEYLREQKSDARVIKSIGTRSNQNLEMLPSKRLKSQSKFPMTPTLKNTRS